MVLRSGTRLSKNNESSDTASAAVLTRSKSRPSSSSIPIIQKKAPANNKTNSEIILSPPLPSREQYNRYINGRNPFSCLTCDDKKLIKNNLHSHIKTKHPNYKLKKFLIKCNICDETFDDPLEATGHSHNDIYPCYKCQGN